MAARAIWHAYANADMTEPCPTCGAPPQTWCTNEVTGRVRRTPCLARARKVPGGDEFSGSTLKTSVDFSEPRRHQE